MIQSPVEHIANRAGIAHLRWAEEKDVTDSWKKEIEYPKPNFFQKLMGKKPKPRLHWNWYGTYFDLTKLPYDVESYGYEKGGRLFLKAYVQIEYRSGYNYSGTQHTIRFDSSDEAYEYYAEIKDQLDKFITITKDPI
jgi:hypothetical protein